MPIFLLLQKKENTDQEQLNIIQNLIPGYKVWVTRTPVQDDPERLADVHISTGFRPPPELLQNGALKWHHQWSAGMDWLLKMPDRESLPIILTNSSGMHAVPIGEHVFAMILAFNRCLIPFFLNKQNNIWKGPGGNLRELPGSTMLILGVGAIGSYIAKLAKAHSMHVLGIRRNPQKSSEYVDEMGSSDDLNRFLPLADYIVAVLPRTPETDHYLDAEHFQMMKPGVFIANAGRGCHINEIALIEALRKGHIRGAGLDTFETEPLPEDSPLWDLDNVIISPHCAGGSKYYAKKALNIFIDNLRLYVNNKPLKNVIDKYLAY